MRGMSAASVPAEAEPAGPTLPPFDYEPMPYTGPSKDTVRSLRKQYLNPGTCSSEASPTSRELGGMAAFV